MSAGDGGAEAWISLAARVQEECFCEDIPLKDYMSTWSEDKLRDFFLAGGLSPISTTQAAGASSSPARTAPASPVPAPPASPPPALQLPPPTPPSSSVTGKGQQHVAGADLRTEDEWRQNHLVRKTHFLCQSCKRAVPRSNLGCPQCQSADLSSSDLNADAAIGLSARLAAHGSTLVSLDLSHNALGARGVSELARALPTMPSLVQLNLSATGAADVGAQALAKAIEEGCPGLRYLELAGSFVKDAGGAAFASMLRAGVALETLNLGWNSIRAHAARELAEAAVKSPLLQRFCGLPLGELRRGQLPPVPPLTERDRARRPAIDPKEELHLQGQGCGAPGAHVVAALLAGLPRLVAIVMPFQDLKEEGAVAIATAAKASCPRLRFLMLSRNDVGWEATLRIRSLLPDLDDFHLRINNRGG